MRNALPMPVKFKKCSVCNCRTSVAELKRGKCKSCRLRRFLVRIVREQVIFAETPKEAKEKYLEGLSAPHCVEVLEKVAGY